MIILRKLLEDNPNGLTLDEIRLKTGGVGHRQIKQHLAKLPVEFDGEFYYLVKSPEHRTELQAKIKEKAMTSSQAEIVKVKKVRSKPFTPNPTRGYEVQKGRVKIFLDRRASSRTLTLSIDDLKELVNAVEKAR